MTKHKYDYDVTDIEALQAAFPKAVEVEKKPVRSVITQLLSCGVEVPGIALKAPDTGEGASAAGSTAATPSAPVADTVKPRTLRDVMGKQEQ